MVVIVLMGLGVGVGLVAVVWGLFPPPLTLRAALARLSGEQVTAPTDVLIHGVGGARRLCGHLLEVNVRKVPKLADIVLPDLAITGTPPETFAVKVVGYGIGLALLGPVAAIAAGAVGVHSGIEVPALGVLVLGGLGVVMPFIDLHQAATRRRRHFCHSLSTYASLVSMANRVVHRLGHGGDRPEPAVGPGLPEATLGGARAIGPAFRHPRPHRSGPIHGPGR
jgi:hypothetical protein